MKELDINKEKFDTKLFLITLFLGWFGIDKLYVGKWKGGWKFFLVKFAYLFILVGIAWNIYDLVMIAKHKYQLDARDYLL